MEEIDLDWQDNV